MASLTPRIDKLDAGRNLIINGNFDFWQRGTTFAAAGASSFSADRWKYTKAGTTAVHTISQSTSVPPLTESQFFSNYSLKIQPTTADAAVAAGDASTFVYHMEGYDFSQINGKKVTLQFWVKSNKIGTYAVAFRSGTNSRSYVIPYEIFSSDVWERKAVTLQLEQWNSSDANFDTGTGLNINFTLMSGSTTQTASINQWISGTFVSGTSQVNFNDSISNTWELAQVILIPEELNTSVVIPFLRAGKTIAEELAMCQRYYEKSYPVAVAPGTAASETGYYTIFSSSTSVHTSTPRFQTPKRRIPDVAVYNVSTGATNSARDTTNGANRTAAADLANENGFRIEITSPVANANNAVHFTANAEL